MFGSLHREKGKGIFFLTNKFKLDNFVPNFKIKVHIVVTCPGEKERERAFKYMEKFYQARIMSLSEGLRLIENG